MSETIEAEHDGRGVSRFDERLAHRHTILLEASAIAPEVARSRGYRTVTEARELRRLGFSEAQARYAPGSHA
jgi:hypothetical protein